MSGPDQPGAVVGVIDLGVGNLHSVGRALQRAGAATVVIASRDQLEATAAVALTHLVLPGVGAFGAAVQALDHRALRAPLLAWVAKGRPLLGICLGMQLLYEASEEGPGAGLALLAGQVRALASRPLCDPPGERISIPHMGWNRLERRRPHPLLGTQSSTGLGGFVYFAHSYVADRAPEAPEVLASCDHGGPLVAAVAKGAVWGVQFHPEKSGAIGAAMLARFVGGASA